MYRSFFTKDISSIANNEAKSTNTIDKSLRCNAGQGHWNGAETPAFRHVSRHNRAFRQILFWSQYQHETPQ